MVEKSSGALVPGMVREVTFYDDLLLVAVVANSAYVALRPITDLLGLEWSAQYRRVQRDEILARVDATPAVGDEPSSAAVRRASRRVGDDRALAHCPDADRHLPAGVENGSRRRRVVRGERRTHVGASGAVGHSDRRAG